MARNRLARAVEGDTLDTVLTVQRARRLEFSDAMRAWVLSGWQLKPGATGARYGASGATQSGSTPTRTTQGAGFEESSVPPLPVNIRDDNWLFQIVKE
jgi:hypothetical protein